jgi:hypothetical protein
MAVNSPTRKTKVIDNQRAEAPVPGINAASGIISVASGARSNMVIALEKTAPAEYAVLILPAPA